MRQMSCDPAIYGIALGIVANAARGRAACATASGSVTVIAPAGADEVSVQFASVFASEGAHMLALNTAAQEELSRAGEAFAEIAGIYSVVDHSSAASLA
ncbi:PE family protein [Mycobacterium spongiae]|uniref:PE domain-containing protein n=1 Tax=Mycobacterium spongiae TaxID=886343 RepID=A0A975JVM1_9MYCO|nr:PE family protein [Mycobacterium spongiae]QUR66517.1 PE domain-containing protein [Mycobacterium spongiae]